MIKEPRRARRADPSPTDASPWALAGLGVQFFVALIVFAYAGNWLDKRAGTAPVLLVLGVFLGGGGSFFLNVRRLSALSNRDTLVRDTTDAPREPPRPQ